MLLFCAAYLGLGLLFAFLFSQIMQEVAEEQSADSATLNLVYVLVILLWWLFVSAIIVRTVLINIERKK